MYLSVFLVDESFVLATLMDDALGRRFGDLVAISGHQRRRLFVGLLQTFTRLTFPSQRRQTRWTGDGRFQFLPKNEKQKNQTTTRTSQQVAGFQSRNPLQHQRRDKFTDFWVKVAPKETTSIDRTCCHFPSMGQLLRLRSLANTPRS